MFRVSDPIETGDVRVTVYVPATDMVASYVSPLALLGSVPLQPAHAELADQSALLPLIQVQLKLPARAADNIASQSNRPSAAAPTAVFRVNRKVMTNLRRQPSLP